MSFLGSVDTPSPTFYRPGDEVTDREMQGCASGVTLKNETLPSTGPSSAAFYYANAERGIQNLFHCQLTLEENDGFPASLGPDHWIFYASPTVQMIPSGLEACSPQNSRDATSAFSKHCATSHPLLPRAPRSRRLLPTVDVCQPGPYTCLLASAMHSFLKTKYSWYIIELVSDVLHSDLIFVYPTMCSPH